jgi:hypothetical protein
MSTHGTIGYELPNNGYAGVYCHYDSYPDVIIPALLKLGHDGVMMAVEKALLEGGFRTFEEDGVETFVEAKGEIEATHRSRLLQTEWPCKQEVYNYIIRLDGSVECVSYGCEPVDISKYVKKFQESA